MEAMLPYQKNILSKVGGIKPSEMMVISAGRQTGKSYYYEYMLNNLFKVQPKFEIIDSALVDGEQWHTVRCAREVSAWVRSMNETQWYEHIDQRGYLDKNIFDMDARLYTMLGMKFS